MVYWLVEGAKQALLNLESLAVDKMTLKGSTWKTSSKGQNHFLSILRHARDVEDLRAPVLLLENEIHRLQKVEDKEDHQLGNNWTS